MRTSVGSRGSPTPKSRIRTPSAARARFASSRRTNGYVVWATRMGERCTPQNLPCAGEEALERLVRARELTGRDPLVAAVRIAGGARSEVDRVEAAHRKLGDGRPGLLRLHGEVPGPP